jgi:hypothetical protein
MRQSRWWRLFHPILGVRRWAKAIDDQAVAAWDLQVGDRVAIADLLVRRKRPTGELLSERESLGVVTWLVQLDRPVLFGIVRRRRIERSSLVRLTDDPAPRSVSVGSANRADVAHLLCAVVPYEGWQPS